MLTSSPPRLKDDDFDFGVLVNKSEFTKSWVEQFQEAVQQGLDKHYELHSSSGGEGEGGARYQTRVVGSYADKIEVYDASSGQCICVTIPTHPHPFSLTHGHWWGTRTPLEGVVGSIPISVPLG